MKPAAWFCAGYRFEFSDDGNNRRSGTIVMLGAEKESITASRSSPESQAAGNDDPDPLFG
jgi:hypothetical protein